MEEEEKKHSIKKPAFEILLIFGVAYFLIGIVLPYVRPVFEEGYLTRADKELYSLKTTLEAFYKDNDSYPSLSQYINGVLTTCSPRLLEEMPRDYFKTFNPRDKIYLYTYAVNNETVNQWFMVGCRGRDRRWQSYFQNNCWIQVGDDLIKSNQPVLSKN